jgi:hypothetical protein
MNKVVGIIGRTQPTVNIITVHGNRMLDGVRETKHKPLIAGQ